MEDMNTETKMSPLYLDFFSDVDTDGQFQTRVYDKVVTSTSLF